MTLGIGWATVFGIIGGFLLGVLVMVIVLRRAFEELIGNIFGW